MTEYQKYQLQRFMDKYRGVRLHTDTLVFSDVMYQTPTGHECQVVYTSVELDSIVDIREDNCIRFKAKTYSSDGNYWGFDEVDSYILHTFFQIPNPLAVSTN